MAGASGTTFRSGSRCRPTCRQRSCSTRARPTPPRIAHSCMRSGRRGRRGGEEETTTRRRGRPLRGGRCGRTTWSARPSASTRALCWCCAGSAGERRRPPPPCLGLPWSAAVRFAALPPRHLSARQVALSAAATVQPGCMRGEPATESNWWCYLRGASRRDERRRILRRVCPDMGECAALMRRYAPVDSLLYREASRRLNASIAEAGPGFLAELAALKGRGGVWGEARRGEAGRAGRRDACHWVRRPGGCASPARRRLAELLRPRARGGAKAALALEPPLSSLSQAGRAAGVGGRRLLRLRGQVGARRRAELLLSARLLRGGPGGDGARLEAARTAGAGRGEPRRRPHPRRASLLGPAVIAQSSLLS